MGTLAQFCFTGFCVPKSCLRHAELFPFPARGAMAIADSDDSRPTVRLHARRVQPDSDCIHPAMATHVDARRHARPRRCAPPMPLLEGRLCSHSMARQEPPRRAEGAQRAAKGAACPCWPAVECISFCTACTDPFEAEMSLLSGCFARLEVGQAGPSSRLPLL